MSQILRFSIWKSCKRIVEIQGRFRGLRYQWQRGQRNLLQVSNQGIPEPAETCGGNRRIFKERQDQIFDIGVFSLSAIYEFSVYATGQVISVPVAN